MDELELASSTFVKPLRSYTTSEKWAERFKGAPGIAARLLGEGGTQSAQHIPIDERWSAFERGTEAVISVLRAADTSGPQHIDRIVLSGSIAKDAAAGPSVSDGLGCVWAYRGPF